MNEFRSCCPVACTLDIIGNKWTPIVVRDLFLGRSHFKDFAASPEGIATNILSNRLEKLLRYELVEKFPSPEVHGKHAYRLTEKGKKLRPILNAIVKLGLEQIDGTEAKLAPS